MQRIVATVRQGDWISMTLRVLTSYIPAFIRQRQMAAISDSPGMYNTLTLCHRASVVVTTDQRCQVNKHV
jgi:hypothetical protein